VVVDPRSSELVVPVAAAHTVAAGAVAHRPLVAVAVHSVDRTLLVVVGVVADKLYVVDLALLAVAVHTASVAVEAEHTALVAVARIVVVLELAVHIAVAVHIALAVPAVAAEHI